MNERYWQSLDMSVSKIVSVEGNLAGNCGTLGADIELYLEEFEIEQFNFESVFFNRDDLLESKKMCLKLGSAHNEIDIALEQAVISMYPGEKARFDVSAPMQSDQVWTTLNFVAERIDDGNQNSSIYEWDSTKKFEFAKASYDKGVELVKSKNYNGAFKMLRQAATVTMFITEDMQPDAKDLHLRSLSNMTLCQKLQNNHHYSIEGINVILEKHQHAPNAFKLIARRGQSQIKLKNYEDAIRDLTQALELDSDNKVIQNDLKTAKIQLKGHDVKLGNAMKKMFS